MFCAEVQAVDDSIAEDTEIFTLQATGSGTLMTAASPTVLNVEVTDNDRKHFLSQTHCHITR